MLNILSNYFDELFTSSHPYMFYEVVDGMYTIVNDTMNNDLDNLPSSEEIFQALNQMHPKKAPGLDGMHTLFYPNFGM